MNIIMLAAGTSSRMGKENKLLIPIDGTPMVAHCAIQALEFLESLAESSNLIVVSGYRSRSTFKALEPCRQFIEKTAGKLKLIIVNNFQYREGQFSSAKTGVAQVEDNKPFFITLADLPRIRPNHYKVIMDNLDCNDAVRPFYKDKPGHPVLLSNKFKDEIENAPYYLSVSEIIKKFSVLELQMDDVAVVQDIDTPIDVKNLQKNLREQDFQILS